MALVLFSWGLLAVRFCLQRPRARTCTRTCKNPSSSRRIPRPVPARCLPHVPAPTSNASAGTTVANTIWERLLNCSPLSLPFADAAGVLEVAAEVDEVSELLLAFGTSLVLDAEVFDIVSDAEVVVDAVKREYPSAA